MWNVSENVWVDLIAHISGDFTYSTQAIEPNKQNRFLLKTKSFTAPQIYMGRATLDSQGDCLPNIIP